MDRRRARGSHVFVLQGESRSPRLSYAEYFHNRNGSYRLLTLPGSGISYRPPRCRPTAAAPPATFLTRAIGMPTRPPLHILEPGDDGNVAYCVICGGTGTLVCCDGCPMAYHALCLGEKAPPEDDDGEWLCPSCAELRPASPSRLLPRCDDERPYKRKRGARGRERPVRFGDSTRRIISLDDSVGKRRKTASRKQREAEEDERGHYPREKPLPGYDRIGRSARMAVRNELDDGTASVMLTPHGSKGLTLSIAARSRVSHAKRRHNMAEEE